MKLDVGFEQILLIGAIGAAAYFFFRAKSAEATGPLQTYYPVTPGIAQQAVSPTSGLTYKTGKIAINVPGSVFSKGLTTLFGEK